MFTSAVEAARRLPLLLLGAWVLAASPSQAQVKGGWSDGASRDQSFSRVLVVGLICAKTRSR